MFLVWLGELITENGIGNGISVIIFGGIVAGMPGLLNQVFNSTHRPLRAGAARVLTIAADRGDRLHAGGGAQDPRAVREERVPRRQDVPAVRAEPYPAAGELRRHDPADLRLLDRHPPGVRSRSTSSTRPATPWIRSDRAPGSANLFSPGNGGGRPAAAPGFYIAVFLLVVAFSFFYTLVVYQQQNLAENLQKQGGFVPGIRPGRPTGEYIMRVLVRITWAGAIFLGIVAVLPYLVTSWFDVTSLTISSTGCSSSSAS